jgi:SRSO17 transposase
LEELKKYMKLFEPAFRRVERVKRSQAYLHGLLGNATRKNVEQMALGLGEKVRSLQYFVGQSRWEEEPVIAIHQASVGETLGEADGIALIDESSVVKQGKESVGVAAQYCGSVGKVANGQVGVCAWVWTYATGFGMASVWPSRWAYQWRQPLQLAWRSP